MRVIPIRTRQVPSKSRRQAHAIVFELRANRKLTSETACLQRIRPSGGIHSAHAVVSSKPRATNAAKHGWIQNATKWLDRDEVRSREPRHPADVDSQYKRYPFGQFTKAVQMKPWTVLLRVSRSASPGN